MRLLKYLLSKSSMLFKKMYRQRYRTYHNCVALTGGAVILAVILLFAAGFSDAGKNKVHAKPQTSAVNSASQVDDEISNVQAGLNGIMEGISSMEAFSRSARAQKVSGVGEEVLIGASKANSDEINRMRLERGISQVSEVGYGASQFVRENQMPSQDYDALLKIVEAEATGCDMKGKVLVANVVLNRVKNSHFPDNIYDVVWERVDGDPQFSPTADGRINTVTVSADTIEAVDRALNGEDYSQGALYFMAKSDSDDINVKWFQSKLEMLFDYGGHEFYTYDGY